MQTRNLVITHVLCSLKVSPLCSARWLSLAMLGCDKWHLFSSYSPPLVQHVSSSVGFDPQKHQPSTAGPSCHARTSWWHDPGQQAGPRASSCPAHGLCHPLLERPEDARGTGQKAGRSSAMALLMDMPCNPCHPQAVGAAFCKDWALLSRDLLA